MRKLITKIKNWFRLPTPKELNFSDSEALGMRQFTPFQDSPMWEDFDDLLKSKYPFKYWLLKTAPRTYWWPIKHKSQHIWYWLQCHLMPWKYNFYKINLTGVDKQSHTTYGYMDPCETLKLAAWHCLINYVEKCKPYDYSDATEEDLKEYWFVSQKKDYEEVMFLYNWWTKDRQEESRIINESHSKHKLLNHETCSKEEYDASTVIWLDLTRAQEEKEEEMFLRVCKLRPMLWT